MAGKKLVADYGSSDSESDIEENQDIEPVSLIAVKEETTLAKPINYFESIDHDAVESSPKEVKKTKKKNKVLANPLRSESFTKSCVEPSLSVFYNPFKKDQEAKNSVLEKHVKLSMNPKDVLEINGKKICWNYRKGRCKFGHKCKYAHDSDLIGAGSVQQNSLTEGQSCPDDYGPSVEAIIQSEAENESHRKRKPGLSEGLIPNKRSRRMYKDIQLSETPWITKN